MCYATPSYTFKPDLIFLTIFQFSLYLPLLLPLSILACIGFLYDVLSLGVLGYYTLCFIAIRLFLEAQKDYLFFKDFYYVWGIFTVLLSCKAFIYMLLGDNIIQATLWTCCLYPLTAKLIQKMFRKWI
jgi:rod shape-determining protein MreD